MPKCDFNKVALILYPFLLQLLVELTTDILVKKFKAHYQAGDNFWQLKAL